MEPIELTDRAVIALAGADSRTFLQNLVSNDMERLEPGKALYTALLSPQGKVLHDFFVTEGDGALLIDVAADGREGLLRKLRLYRLRAKVEIEPREMLGVYVALAGHPDGRPAPYRDRAISFADPRHPGLPLRSIGARAEMPAGLPGPAAYHALRLSLGVPEGSDFGQEKVFALEAGLEELSGVSFEKGCYIGQELTARMKHRAAARKRILLAEADTPLPAAGTALNAGAELGELLAVYGTKGFALVRLDRLEAAGTDTVTAGDLPVRLARPSYLYA